MTKERIRELAKKVLENQQANQGRNLAFSTGVVCKGQPDEVFFAVLARAEILVRLEACRKKERPRSPAKKNEEIRFANSAESWLSRADINS